TLAHEIGHVALHADEWLGAAARGGGGRRVRERQVERFAAELLMPTDFVRDRFSMSVDAQWRFASPNSASPAKRPALATASRASVEVQHKLLDIGRIAIQ